MTPFISQKSKLSQLQITNYPTADQLCCPKIACLNKSFHPQLMGEYHKQPWIGLFTCVVQPVSREK